jgi:hypothetical protein
MTTEPSGTTTKRWVGYSGITGTTGPSGAVGEIPDFYIDGVKIQYNQVGVALVLLRSKPQLGEETPVNEAVATLRMSPQMAGQLATIIYSALETLQAQGEPQADASLASENTAPRLDRESRPSEPTLTS